MYFFCNSLNLHNRGHKENIFKLLFTFTSVNIDYIIHCKQNSLNYYMYIIGQFEELNSRAIEVPKELLTFNLCQ